MSMRVLLAIALLGQSFALAGPMRIVDALAAGGACDCGTVCCCGDGTDACMCAAGPDQPQRRPEAPAPRDGKNLAPLLALPLTGVVARRPDLARLALRPKAQPVPDKSHNEVQALLCVWRT